MTRDWRETGFQYFLYQIQTVSEKNTSAISVAFLPFSLQIFQAWLRRSVFFLSVIHIQANLLCGIAVLNKTQIFFCLPQVAGMFTSRGMRCTTTVASRSTIRQTCRPHKTTCCWSSSVRSSMSRASTH